MNMTCQYDMKKDFDFKINLKDFCLEIHIDRVNSYSPL